MIKIGIIREGKTPPDSRVPLDPAHCAFIQQNFPFDIIVQPAPGRCFPDESYTNANVKLSNDLSDRDILMGVKEVPVSQLLPGKTYFFFSHTIKKQPYNQQLLWAILDKHIKLIDYEALKNDKGQRLIAFGRFAGMVGAHNALWTFSKRTGQFDLPRMTSFIDYTEAKRFYKSLSFPPVKIVLTGTGRVAMGALTVLLDMGIKKVDPQRFLKEQFDHPVFTQLAPTDYVIRKDGRSFNKKDFYKNPTAYNSNFAAYQKVSDIMINGIYWDPAAPSFFSREEMAQPDFSIKVIADVTCDIAPVSSVPATIRPSTIPDPVYGFDPASGREIPPFLPEGIDIMAIDNLPNELPRDASRAFGDQFINFIMPELLKEKSAMLEKATVAENGVLGKHFRYLEDYAAIPAQENNLGMV